MHFEKFKLMHFGKFEWTWILKNPNEVAFLMIHKNARFKNFVWIQISKNFQKIRMNLHREKLRFQVYLAERDKYVNASVSVWS